MVGNKKRLYIALYPSGVSNNEERKYHWGFIVGPKNEGAFEVAGMRYHVKNKAMDGWIYEEIKLRNVKSTVNLLARVLVAKVEDEKRLVEIFRNTPIVQNDPNWRCRTWVAHVLEQLRADGKAVGTSQLDWAAIEKFAREYVKDKTAAGRYTKAEEMVKPKPMWDLLQGKEIVK